MTFEQFVVPRVAAWLRFATAVSADRTLAEDFVQEVLLKVHQGWSRISMLDNPEAYVLRMLANEHSSWRRKWGRQSSMANVFEGVAAPVAVDPASRVADRAELVQLLFGLPQKQRAVLAMRYLVDLPDESIAGVLDCSVGTVRAQASRGLAALRVQQAGNRCTEEATLDAR